MDNRQGTYGQRTGYETVTYKQKTGDYRQGTGVYRQGIGDCKGTGTAGGLMKLVDTFARSDQISRGTEGHKIGGLTERGLGLMDRGRMNRGQGIKDRGQWLLAGRLNWKINFIALIL